MIQMAGDSKGNYSWGYGVIFMNIVANLLYYDIHGPAADVVSVYPRCKCIPTLSGPIFLLCIKNP